MFPSVDAAILVAYRTGLGTAFNCLAAAGTAAAAVRKGVAPAVPAAAAAPATAAAPVLTFASSHKTPAIPRPPSTYDGHCIGSTAAGTAGKADRVETTAALASGSSGSPGPSPRGCSSGGWICLLNRSAFLMIGATWFVLRTQRLINNRLISLQ